METFPVVAIFVLAGLFPFKYSENLKMFKICPPLVVLSVFVFTLFIGYDIYIAIFRFCQLRLLYNEKQQNAKNMGEIINKIDHIVWVVMHCSNPIAVFIKMRRVCKIMNSLDNVVQKLATSSFSIDHNLLSKKMKQIIIAFIVSTIICTRLGFRWTDSYTIRDLIHGLSFSVFFTVTQLHEFVLFAKARYYYKSLQDHFYPQSHPKFIIWAAMHDELWKISKMNCKMFALTKMINLVCVIVLMSAYWFYNYDNIMNMCASFAWQLTLLPVFFLCWSWNELDKEVSHLIRFLIAIL